jgi:hypothetical protein
MADAPVKRRGPGRPTKFTPEVRDTICEYLEKGYTHDAAAGKAGVAPAAYYAWKAKAQDPDAPPIFVEFLERVKRSVAKGEAKLVESFFDAAGNDWKAYMTYLERRFPQRFARRVYKPQDEGSGGDITVIFRMPEANPDDPGDTLAQAGSTDGAPGQGPPPGPGLAAHERSEAKAKASGNGNGGQ